MDNIYFQQIVEKVPNADFLHCSSRTSLRRRKNWKTKSKKLYFGIGVSFNIDWNRARWKPIYKNVLENVKKTIDEDDIDFLVNRLEKNFYKISKNVAIKDVNSKWKLFMHLLFILPYVKQVDEKETIRNMEWFIARVLFNCTRSWYTNYCKKLTNKSLWENQ